MKNPLNSVAVDLASIGIVAGISFVAGALAGFWCSAVISETTVWVRALLGGMIGGSAATSALLVFFAFYEVLTQKHTHPGGPLLWTLLYHSPTALFWSLLGVVGGATVLGSLKSGKLM